MELLIKELNKKYPAFLIHATKSNKIYYISIYRKPYKANSQPLEDYIVSKEEYVTGVLNEIESKIQSTIKSNKSGIENRAELRNEIRKIIKFGQHPEKVEIMLDEIMELL